jgi:hypothetical protein
MRTKPLNIRFQPYEKLLLKNKRYKLARCEGQGTFYTVNNNINLFMYYGKQYGDSSRRLKMELQPTVYL